MSSTTTSPTTAGSAGLGGQEHLRLHVARLLITDPGTAAQLAAGPLGRPLRRLAQPAAPLPLLALLALDDLFCSAQGSQALLAAEFGLLAALTATHLLVVGWLDRQPAPGTLPLAQGRRS